MCLYCLEEARARARARRNRALTRAALVAVGGGVAVALIVGAITALVPSSAAVVVASVDSIGPAGAIQAGDVVDSTARRLIQPIIAEGSRGLGDSIVAERVGNSVTVTFDTDQLRTRFDWKFEGVVRGTLPMVFGDPAAKALDAIPQGELVREDLIRTAPRRGIAMELPDDGGTLTLWPITRPGRDGPIVVAYRVTPTK
ncbi:MAG: hypothetical protein WD801_11240 [Gemmatimonadaceae bacterium]